jgi:6-phosphogluconolactonase
VPKFNTHRITFTFPLIDAAKHVCFLVNDPKKESVIQQVLSKSGGYPSESVAPASGKLTWLLGK